MEDKKTQNCPLCGTLCEVIHEHIEGEKPVEEIWESFWKPIVSNEDGTINIEQVKKELADFSFVMEQVPKVYCHITGDMLSKVMYRAEDVIRMADDHFNEALREAVKQEREDEAAPSGEREGDAVAFNIYCTDSYYYENGFWWHKENHDPYSVDQLYDIFKQQNRNNENG